MIKHFVHILPFAVGDTSYVLVKSNVPPATLILIAGTDVPMAISIFCQRYAHEIIDSIRYNRPISIFLGPPIGGLSEMALEVLDNSDVVGVYHSLDTHSMDLFRKAIDEVCKTAMPAP